MAIQVAFFVLLLIGLATCDSSHQCPPKENVESCRCQTNRRDFRYVEARCYWNDLEKNLNQFKENYAAKQDILLEVTLSRHEGQTVSFPSKMFDGLDIKVLTIKNGDISPWSDEKGGPAFVGLENTLEELRLMDNRVTTDDETPYNERPALMKLGHLRKLKKLYINSHKLYKFNDEYLEGDLKSLRTVDVSKNFIWFVGDNAFAGLPKLREINLNYNTIGKLKRSMFPDPALYLEKILVKESRLKELPYDIFSNMPALKEIELYGNHLVDIPEQTWRPIWSNLNLLSIDHNNIMCDDRIEWVFDVRPPKKLWVTCYGPEDKKHEDLDHLIRERQKEDDSDEEEEE